MANWGAPKSGVSPKQTAWEFYIEGKADWKNYEKGLVLEDDTVIFLDRGGKKTRKVKAKTSVILKSSKSEVLPSGVFLEDTPKRPSTMYAKVKIGSNHGWVRIDKIAKPKRNTTEKEDIALKHLDRAIKNRLPGKNKKIGICIIIKKHGRINQTYIGCTGARTIRGTPKSDFAIINGRNNEICQISHKDAGGPKAYQQYGSTTLASGQKIHENKILQSAFRKFVGKKEEIVNERKRFKVAIPFNNAGKELINLSIYGPEYGGPRSKENVDFIAQGKPTLEEYLGKERRTALNHCGLVYELKFSDSIEVNGSVDHFKRGGYEPYIIARYSSGRSFDVDGVKTNDVRVLIAPTVLAQTAEVI